MCFLSGSHEEPDRAAPVEIPCGELSAEALRGIAESFVLREGTDYGDREVPFEAKVEQVLRQLMRGEAQILFDPSTESVDIVVSARTHASRSDSGPG